jgi:hypothetical protein
MIKSKTMPNSDLSFARPFQMWMFTVGHRRLLLRSPKTDHLLTRVDVLFTNVAAINLPTKLNELTVSEATEAEMSELCIQIESSKLVGRKVFAIRDSGSLWHVVGGAVAWHEDERSYNEPSQFPLMPGDVRE